MWRKLFFGGVFVFIVGLMFRGLPVIAAEPMTMGLDNEEPTQAQPILPKQQLVIISANGRHIFSVELARTARQQQVGEMIRKSVPEDGGMLFLWSKPQPIEMWMRNTLVPLDMVFIGTDRRIQAIAENTLPQSLAHIRSHGPVIATLELAGGVTAKLGIVVGDKVEAASLNPVEYKKREDKK